MARLLHRWHCRCSRGEPMDVPAAASGTEPSACVRIFAVCSELQEPLSRPAATAEAAAKGVECQCFELLYGVMDSLLVANSVRQGGHTCHIRADRLNHDMAIKACSDGWPIVHACTRLQLASKAKVMLAAGVMRSWSERATAHAVQRFAGC